MGIPKPGILKSGIPKPGIPKSGIPKVEKTPTATLPETEFAKPGIPKSDTGCPEDPARHLNPSRQKLTPHCLAAILGLAITLAQIVY